MKKLILLLAVFANLLWGQGTTVPSTITLFAGAPSGSCAPRRLAINTTNGDLYDCLSSSWNLVASGGGGACGALGGDLSGTCAAATVARINGVALGSTTATAGNLLIGSGTQWVTRAVSGDATLSSTGAVTLANTAVTPGAYTNANITVDSKGRLTAAASGSAGISGSGTNNTLTKWTGAASLGDSGFLAEDASFLISSGPFDVRTNALVIERPNAAVTGTTLNRLAVINTSGNAVLPGTTEPDISNIIGCVVGGAGTTGNARIAILGQAACFFDNTATTTGDYVIASTTTAGTLNDAGSTFPASGMVLGKVMSTNAPCGSPPCGPYQVVFMTPDVAATGSGQGGKIANAAAGNVAFYTGTNKIGGENNLHWVTATNRLSINAGTSPAVELHAMYNAANSGGAAVVTMDNPAGGNTTAFNLCHNGASCTGVQSDISATNRFGFFTDRANIEFDNSSGAAGSYTFFVNTTGNVKLGGSNKFFLNGGQSAVGINADPGTTQHFLVTSVDDSKAIVRLNSAPSDPRGNAASIEFFNNVAVVSTIGPMYKPSTVGTTPGTAEADIINFTGGGGGDTTIATTGTGGVGGAIIFTATVGGVANSANTASTGGAGGPVTITSGTGGAATVATGTNTGGAGGTLTLAGANGGNASGGTTNTGGAGADILLNPGSGGTGATAAGRAGFVQVGGTFRYKSSANVASAATVTLPSGNFFHITGTTNVTTLNTCDANNNGDVIVLIFDGGLTFTDGNNLKLAGNFVTTADDTITLGCDGSNWFEIARSVN